MIDAIAETECLHWLERGPLNTAKASPDEVAAPDESGIVSRQQDVTWSEEDIDALLMWAGSGAYGLGPGDIS
jgi:hypothetical protein